MVNNMSRTMKLGKDRLVAGASEIIVELSQGEIAVIALELTLLLGGLVDFACLVSGAARLVLQIAEQGRVVTTFSREAGERVRCSLSRDNAEYLQMSLLRAYRDGMAEVNHIHIEGKLDGESFDLTLLFDTSRPPMTPEEAEKIMGR
jgi:hypothetical protein